MVNQNKLDIIPFYFEDEIDNKRFREGDQLLVVDNITDSFLIKELYALYFLNLDNIEILYCLLHNDIVVGDIPIIKINDLNKLFIDPITDSLNKLKKYGLQLYHDICYLINKPNIIEILNDVFTNKRVIEIIINMINDITFSWKQTKLVYMSETYLIVYVGTIRYQILKTESIWKSISINEPISYNLNHQYNRETLTKGYLSSEELHLNLVCLIKHNKNSLCQNLFYYPFIKKYGKIGLVSHSATNTYLKLNKTDELIDITDFQNKQFVDYGEVSNLSFFIRVPYKLGVNDIIYTTISMKYDKKNLYQRHIISDIRFNDRLLHFEYYLVHINSGDTYWVDLVRSNFFYEKEVRKAPAAQMVKLARQESYLDRI